MTNIIERLLETDLTDEELERLEDLIARAPLTQKPVDARLLELKWITHYTMLEGPQNVVTTFPERCGVETYNDTAMLYSEYRRRRGKWVNP